jgi:ABC-type oligopeptide transport system substrate-binding subunit
MKYLTIAFLFLFSSLAFAQHNCVGKLVNVDISGNSGVQLQVEGIGEGNILCSLNTQMGQYQPEACKAAFALLLTDKAANKNVRLWFNNDTNTACFKGNWVNLANSGVYHLSTSFAL